MRRIASVCKLNSKWQLWQPCQRATGTDKLMHFTTSYQNQDLYSKWH